MQGFETETRERLQTALKKADTTQYIEVGYKSIQHVGEMFKQCFPGKKAIVIADTNTFEAAGKHVQKVLESQIEGTLPPYIFEVEDMHAEMQHVDLLTTYLASIDAIAVAVGSGTINDLTKLASYRNQRQYMVVVTAASVDGYTAFGASITSGGFKQTFQCPAPRGVIADIDVLSQAPKEMNAWGYADLIAKIPAGADWMLADALGIEAIDPVSWNLVQAPLRDLTSDPAGVRDGDAKALCFLIEGLLMSGLAMQHLGSSRPASGAEHQFSHLWDIEHHTHHGITPSHGFKVAIGSLSSLALYEQILPLDFQDRNWSLSEIQARWTSFDIIEKRIRSRFPDDMIAQQILEQARGKYITAEILHNRLKVLSELWPELRPRLEQQVIPFGELRSKLGQVAGPQRPEDIGIDLMRLKNSYEFARYIRTRYTLLDVAHETGLTGICLYQIFKNDVYWPGSKRVVETENAVS